MPTSPQILSSLSIIPSIIPLILSHLSLFSVLSLSFFVFNHSSLPSSTSLIPDPLQHLLHDRRRVYERLEMFGLPVPRYALVNREFPNQELDYFVEEEDFVEVHGSRFWKPFVEKPVHGDDHSIMIYYPSSAGGGMKELFRKVGNRSSEFHPEVRRVRREGSYIYEEFIPIGGTDVKVYTMGPEYAHAEARKSPVVDGVVMRNPDGEEVIFMCARMDVSGSTKNPLNLSGSCRSRGWFVKLRRISRRI